MNSILQKEIAIAFEEASRLVDQFGEDDPRALQAIIRAVDMKDPGFIKATMKECGINMPKATHCSDSGEPLFSIDQIAKSVGRNPQEVMQEAKRLLDSIDGSFATSSHRIQ